MIIKGKAIKYGNDVNTDVIIPGRYLHLTDPEEMVKHVLEDLDPDFLKKFHIGDVVVAGRNFGCGSSREQAVMCLKYAGVGCIVAKSFARIFYRNAINQGLPVVESPDAADIIDSGDELEIDINEGFIVDKTKNLRFSFHPIPGFIKKILEAGGLIPRLKKLGEE